MDFRVILCCISTFFILFLIVLAGAIQNPVNSNDDYYDENYYYNYASDMACQKFSIELPSGFEETDGWGSDNEHINEIYAGTGIPNKGEVHRWLTIIEAGTTEEYEGYDYSTLYNSEYLLDDFSDDDLYVGKFSAPKTQSNDSGNFTYAHFDKNGYHYEMVIKYNGNINSRSLSEDVDLVKGVKNSVHHKS